VILLDTCALLWLAEGSPRISEPVLTRIDAEPIVSVSAISALEIGLKTRSGKLRLPMPPDEWWRAVCEHHSLNVVLVEPATYIRSTELPPIHNDPVDRIIVATAEYLRATVVTADSHFPDYGVDVVL
jgi:PIN domain nuclease of toxin-antitoxin system